ncbi:MAG: amidophosphoribosyltransferase, partial [Planctomycetota bacterium]
MREKCGVFGIFGAKGAAYLTYAGLYALQHRGQESAGIAVSDGRGLRLHTGMGRVMEVFGEGV